MLRKLCYLSIGLLCASACGPRPSGHTAASVAPSADTLTTLVLPAIPVMMTTPEQRASYLVQHYWDLVNFADTHYIHHPEITEQGWANFLDLLTLVSDEEAYDALQRVMRQAETNKKCYHYMRQLAERYLYDPNSPLRNEEHYIAVLDALLTSPLLSETEKIRPQNQRNLAQRNRRGTQAHDFAYTLANGATGRLHQLRSPYTLLFFNNPGCHNCAQTIDFLSQSPVIQRALQQGQLQILSLYPDEDLKEWKEHQAQYPRQWINAYDKKQVIQHQSLYDLKAIPSLYLLDKDKYVILKDCTPDAAEHWLSQLP